MPWRSVELNYLLFPKPQKDKVMQNVIKNPQIQIFSFGFLNWETRNTNFHVLESRKYTTVSLKCYVCQ